MGRAKKIQKTTGEILVKIHIKDFFQEQITKYLWPLSVVTIISSLIQLSESINCYSCDSSSDFSCSEFWDPSLDVNRQYYSDCKTVHDANYCVKMTGVFDGKLGTKRFCSSRDWGDYCEYIQRPGDPREYRSCVFACTDHGCNGSNSLNQSSILALPILLCMSLISKYF